MENILVVVHVLIALSIIGLVLLQQGKGADAGASFGGGSSQTVFGSQGASSFLSRITMVLSALFFITSLFLAVYASERAKRLNDLGVPGQVIETTEPSRAVEKENNSEPSLDEPTIIIPN